MKKVFLKSISLALILVLSLGMLTGCGKQEEEVNALVDAAVEAALADAVVPITVTIDADGKQLTIEQADGMRIQQLLDQAKITLKEGDVLSFDTNQVIGGDLLIRVLRTCHVTVTVTAEDPAQSISYHAVLTGGTVADAIAAVGVKINEKQTANHKMEDALLDNMEIIISTVKTEQKKVAETEPAETTEAGTGEDDSYDDEDDWYEEDWSDDDWYDDDWYEEPATTPPATEPPATEPPATEPPATEPPTEPERYVVSEEIYEDCDGSGHGVKVITYSDGTQEEVYF